MYKSRLTAILLHFKLCIAVFVILVQVYDITSRSSFAALQMWVKELHDNGPEGAIICVCGNKSDYESARVRTAVPYKLLAKLLNCYP